MDGEPRRARASGHFSAADQLPPDGSEPAVRQRRDGVMRVRHEPGMLLVPDATRAAGREEQGEREMLLHFARTKLLLRRGLLLAELLDHLLLRSPRHRLV